MSQTNQSSALAPSRWATLPAVAYLVVVTQMPLIATLYFSLHSSSLLHLERPIRFIGLGNFEFILSDPNFRMSIFNTALYAVMPGLVTAIPELLLALLVNKLSFSRGLAYSLLFDVSAEYALEVEGMAA